MRADAARNLSAILEATRDLIATEGLDFTMEQVAAAAGVGMGTVYRRFPDRATLLHTVVQELITEVGIMLDTAQTGLDDHASPGARWDAYFGAAFTSALPHLLPHLLRASADPTVFDDEVNLSRDATLARIQGALAEAQASGHVRDDVTLLDVGLLAAAATRPVPGLPAALQENLIQRRRALVVSSLRPLRPQDPRLPGHASQPEDAFRLIAAPPLKTT